MVEVQKRAVDLVLRQFYDEQAIDEWIIAIDIAKFERAATDGNIHLIAEEDGRVVGFASFNTERSLIGMWYVDPELQQMGIGKALLEVAELALYDAGVEVAWTEASVHARPRFEKLGWSVDKEYEKAAFGGAFRVARMTKTLRESS